MNIEHLRENGIDIAVVSGDETVVVDVVRIVRIFTF